jgi:hypothetical protein
MKANNRVVRRGPIPKLGKLRDNFYPGDRLMALIQTTQKRYAAAGIKIPSKSLIYRQGAYIFCRKLNADLNKAQIGELHAKSRK